MSPDTAMNPFSASTHHCGGVHVAVKPAAVACTIQLSVAPAVQPRLLRQAAQQQQRLLAVGAVPACGVHWQEAALHWVKELKPD